MSTAVSNPADGATAAITDGCPMTYLLTTNGNGDQDTYLQVVARVDAHAHGLIARYAGMNERGLAITTVWESKAQADRFTAEHLLPALRAIAGGDGDGPAVTVDFEAFEAFQPGRAGAAGSGAVQSQPA
jgi:hypothetical protein